MDRGVLEETSLQIRSARARRRRRRRRTRRTRRGTRRSTSCTEHALRSRSRKQPAALPYKGNIARTLAQHNVHTPAQSTHHTRVRKNVQCVLATRSYWMGPLGLEPKTPHTQTHRNPSLHSSSRDGPRGDIECPFSKNMFLCGVLVAHRWFIRNYLQAWGSMLLVIKMSLELWRAWTARCISPSTNISN